MRDRFNSENAEENDELFLMQKLYDDIFKCGKSLALLKICDPKVVIQLMSL